MPYFIMRHRRTIGFCLLAAAAFLAVAAVVWPREPRYHHRPLSAWLGELDLDQAGSAKQAEQALRALGTNCIPCLLKMICARDSLWERAAVSIERHQPMVRFQLTPTSVVRYRAVLGFRVLRAGARDAVPALIQLLESTKPPPLRASAAAALGGIGPAAEAAVSSLAKAVEDPDPEVRRNANAALFNIQRSAEGGDRARVLY
ncbi:MAG: HEAT repeat domain-containing protein [Limisphaerales bacterium]